MRILALSGSLRKGSSNTAILHVAASLAPAGVEIKLCPDLGGLPHFNPDLDLKDTPPAVLEFRRQVAAAGALLISTPEYAHGIPGVLKNALDWLVSEIDFAGKPVGLIFGSATDGSFAQAALIEVLNTMSARVAREAILSVPGARVKLGADGKLLDAEVAAKLAALVRALAAPT